VPLGFIFALAYLWLAQPTSVTICVGSVVVAIGLAVRAIASGQLRKNEDLAMSGPYSYTRNPLYLGSLLIGVGVRFGGPQSLDLDFPAGDVRRDLRARNGE